MLGIEVLQGVSLRVNWCAFMDVCAFVDTTSVRLWTQQCALMDVVIVETKATFVARKLFSYGANVAVA